MSSEYHFMMDVASAAVFVFPGRCASFRNSKAVFAKYSRIVNFVDCSVAHRLGQRLVISNDDEMIATLCEVA